jgi:hypothetical protein
VTGGVPGMASGPTWASNREVKTEREVTRRCKSSGVQVTESVADRQVRRREASVRRKP